jgi:type I restriction enzyme S subunit
MSNTLVSQIRSENTPDGWKTVRLGEVVALRKEPVDPKKESELPYVGLEHIESGRIDLTRWGKGTEVSSLKSRFSKNDILYGKLRPYLDKAVIAPVQGLCSTDILVLKPLDSILPEFIAQILHTQEFISYANSTTTGVNHPRTSWNAIQEFTFPLPPTSGQGEIAYVLSTIRKAQQVTREVIEAGRELRKTLLTRFLRRNETKEGHSLVDEDITEIGKLPIGWGTAKIGELFDIQQGKAVSPKARTGDSPRLFLRTANVFWGRIDTTSIDRMDFSDEEAKFYELKPGDLLICEGGDIGRTAIWNGEVEPCYYQNHIHRLRPRNQNTIPLFYMYWMDAAINLFGLYVGQGNRTTIPNLSKGRLSSFVVPVPPSNEQRRIAAHLKTLDEKMTAEEKRLAQLQNLCQTLLHELLSGKIHLSHRGD